jgi:hypothetical protein
VRLTKRIIELRFDENLRSSVRDIPRQLNRKAPKRNQSSRQKSSSNPSPTRFGAACAEPEPWAGQRLCAQVLGKVQIRNTKEVFWEIVSVDQHGKPITQRRKASKASRFRWFGILASSGHL